MCVCAPCSHRGCIELYTELSSFRAGGARDAQWTGANEDASVASVKSIRDAGLTYLLKNNVRRAQAVYFVVSFSRGLMCGDELGFSARASSPCRPLARWFILEELLAT